MSEQTLDGLGAAARAALALAREEADRLGHAYVGSEHLLLGLLRQDHVLARVLGDLGVTAEAVRGAVTALVGRGERPHAGETRLTPRARACVDLARLEARWMRQAEAGAEHLVLGLLREGEGIAAGVLESLGVDPRRLRFALRNADRRFGDGPAPGRPAGAWTRTAARTGPGGARGYSRALSNTRGATPELRTLVGVTAVAAALGGEDLRLVVPSLERYAEGFLVHCQLRYRAANPDDHRFPELVFEAADDCGNRYGCWAGGGYGGGGEAERIWRRDYVFQPALDPGARELRLRVAPVEWQRHDPTSNRLVADETRPVDWLLTVPLV